MVWLQILTEKKYQPKHVGLYFSLKPQKIVIKFLQKLSGFLNYYYEFLTSPSDLNFYCYVLKLSCLKTLSFKMKESITQILKIYRNNINIEFIEKKSKRKNILILKYCRLTLLKKNKLMKEKKYV